MLARINTWKGHGPSYWGSMFWSVVDVRQRQAQQQQQQQQQQHGKTEVRPLSGPQPVPCARNPSGCTSLGDCGSQQAAKLSTPLPIDLPVPGGLLSGRWSRQSELDVQSQTRSFVPTSSEAPVVTGLGRVRDSVISGQTRHPSEQESKGTCRQYDSTGAHAPTPIDLSLPSSTASHTREKRAQGERGKDREGESGSEDAGVSLSLIHI